MTSFSSSTSLPTSMRLPSIDVFRGAVIVAMILVNAQYSPEESYRQFVHSAWNGWTFADTIFPCFLFVVGVSLALSNASRADRGEDRTRLLAHAIQRALLIFACGVAIDYLRVPAHEFPFVGFQPHLQLTGALERIAVCYLVAFNIFLWTDLRGVIVGILGFNLLYLGLLYFYPVPGCGAGSLVVSCNFPGFVDDEVLDGFRWNSTAFDPDGVGSILPVITLVLFGVLAGQFVPRKAPRLRGLFQLLGAGLALIVLGELLSIWVPINKQLWTPSFAFLTAGMATTGLACFIWLVDGRPFRHWFKPLEIFGRNALAAYLISRVVQNVPRVHVMGRSLYTDILVRFASPPAASLLFAMLVLAAVYLAVWVMHRRHWYLKF